MLEEVSSPDIFASGTAGREDRVAEWIGKQYLVKVLLLYGKSAHVRFYPLDISVEVFNAFGKECDVLQAFI